MKYATVPELCCICGIGTTHPTMSTRMDDDLGTEIRLEFSICDHCECETANADQLSINKLRYLEATCIPQVLVLHTLVKTNYPLSPHVYFDERCDPKRTKALLERKSSSSIADELFDAQMALAATFREFTFAYATGAGSTPFHYLAGQYGLLNLRIKEMKALAKKYGKQEEVVEYLRVLDSNVLNISPYDMMKSDFELMMPVFEQRRRIDVKRFPKNDMLWETLNIDWELVNKNFKQAK